MKIIFLSLCFNYLCVACVVGQSNITPLPIEPDQAGTENVDITNAFIEELVEAAKGFGCKHISQLGEFCV